MTTSRLRFLIAVVLVAPALFAVTPAHASDPQYVGPLGCTFAIQPLDAGVLAVVQGGPAGVVDRESKLPANPVTLSCSVNGFAFYSPPGVGVTVLPPATVATTAPITVCFRMWAKLPDGTWIPPLAVCETIVW